MQVERGRQVLYSFVEDADMASVLCEKCSQLLKQFAVQLRRVCREFTKNVRDVFRELSHCTCSRIAPESTYLRRTTTLPHLYGRTIVILRFLYGQYSCGSVFLSFEK